MLDGPLVFVDVDTQRDFLDPDGALSIAGAGAIRPTLARLTAFARGAASRSWPPPAPTAGRPRGATSRRIASSAPPGQARVAETAVAEAGDRRAGVGPAPGSRPAAPDDPQAGV